MWQKERCPMFTERIPFRMTGTLVMAAAVAMLIPAIASAELIADYEFNQNLNDSASNPADLTVAGGGTPTYVAGPGGLSAIRMGYGGAGGLVGQLNSSATKLKLNGATAFTIEGYFRVDLVQNGWNQANFVTNWHPYMLGAAVGANGSSVVDAWVYNGSEVDPAGGSAVVNGEWQYLALTYQGSVLTLYQNGKSVATNAFSGSLDCNIPDAFNFQINNYWYQGFTGDVASVKIWDNCVSSDYLATRAAAVPEPSTLSLLTAALIGLLCYAWRKRT
jgi:hypothetical protein